MCGTQKATGQPYSSAVPSLSSCSSFSWKILALAITSVIIVYYITNVPHIHAQMHGYSLATMFDFAVYCSHISLISFSGLAQYDPDTDHLFL